MTETRAEKAQRLVDEALVEIRNHGPVYTEAYVEGDSTIHYVLLFSTGHFYCGCDWGRHHSYTDDLCSHALAVKLAVERKDKLC